MPERKVVVIGAGLAGLATAIYLRVNGYGVQVFERQSGPGGVAATWQRGPYTIDGGLHFVMDHRPGTAINALYEELGIAGKTPFIDLETYSRFVDERLGLSVLVDRSLEFSGLDRTALSPRDRRTLGDLVHGARALARADLAAPFAKPPALSGARDSLRQLRGLGGAARYITGRYGHPLAEYARHIEDPALRSLVLGLFLPEVPVWFVLVLLGLLSQGRIGLAPEGSAGFVGCLERRCRELGGELSYRAEVERILVEHDRAVGVRLADGSEHRADVVVSAADGSSTIFHLLEGRYTSARIRTRYRNWPLFRSLVAVSLGVRSTFAGQCPFTTIQLADPIELGAERTRSLFVRTFDHAPGFAPPGHSVLQAELESDFDTWWELEKRDHEAYLRLKRSAAEQVLERLEPHFPGVSDSVEVTDVSTPVTIFRHTRNHKGAYEGWLPTPVALTASVERTLPGLEGFLMAGQWVMPGGGVPPCLFSGRHVAQMLCHEDRRPFRSR